MTKQLLNPRQKQLVEDHLYLVERMLKRHNRLYGRSPVTEWDDLYQTGCLALCRAAQHRDPKLPFAPYACRAIQNAMIDYSVQISRYHQIHGPWEDFLEVADDNPPDPLQFLQETEILEILKDRHASSTGVVRKGIYSLVRKSMGYSSTDISRDFQVSSNSVRAWMSLAAKQLRADEDLKQFAS